MDPNKAAEELKVIRALMERPIRYSTMSGLSGILAGCVALAGVAADWLICQHYEPYSNVMLVNFLVWGSVLAIAVAGVLGLTRWRERRQGMSFWSPVKRKILLTILPTFAAGMGLTAAIVFRVYVVDKAPSELDLIPTIWMTFYGLACWQVGEFSIPEMRILGLAFILVGVASAGLFQTHVEPYRSATTHWALGSSFGGFHVVYGIVVRARHGG